MTISDRARLALVVSLVLAPAVARADTDEQKAVALFDKGRKLAKDGRCAEAIAPLLESIRYAEGVGPLLNLGSCYETLGKLASAHRYFVRARDIAAERDDRRRDEATQRARALEKDLSMLIVHVPAPLRASAEVRVDGEAWPSKLWDAPAPIDAGSHEIEVVAPPRPKVLETVVVRGKGERFEWFLPEPSLVPPGPPPAAPLPPRVDGAPPTDVAGEPPSSGQRTLGFVVGGVGIAGLVAGAIFGVISISAHSSVVGRCRTYPRCDLSDRAELDDMNQRAQTTGTISTIAIIAGAVLLAGGATLFFSAPTPKRAR